MGITRGVYRLSYSYKTLFRQIIQRFFWVSLPVQPPCLYYVLSVGISMHIPYKIPFAHFIIPAVMKQKQVLLYANEHSFSLCTIYGMSYASRNV